MQMHEEWNLGPWNNPHSAMGPTLAGLMDQLLRLYEENTEASCHIADELVVEWGWLLADWESGVKMRRL